MVRPTGGRRRAASDRRGHHPDRAAGCAPSSTRTARTRSPCTCRARCRWRRSTWPTSWPRASSAPTRSSRTRGCAWRAPARGYKLSLGADGPPGLVRRLRPRRRVLRDRLEHGRLPPDPVPADDGPGQGRREADRRRPAAHRHRRQGRPVPADHAGHRPGPAERPAAPAGRGRRHLDEHVHRRLHRGLGRRCRPCWRTTRPTVVAEITGVSARRPAHRRGAGSVQPTTWMSCWTMGLNQSTHGTWNTNALINLHLATGAICRPGSGPFSLTGQPNAMGGREMGYMGPGLPGQRSRAGSGRPRVHRTLWGLPDGTPAHRGRAAAPSTCSAGWPPVRSRPAGSSAPIRSPRWPTGAQVIAGLEAVRAGDHPGRLRRHRDQRATPTCCCPRRCGPRSDGVDGQLRAQPDPAAAGRRPAR